MTRQKAPALECVTPRLPVEVKSRHGEVSPDMQGVTELRAVASSLHGTSLASGPLCWSWTDRVGECYAISSQFP